MPNVVDTLMEMGFSKLQAELAITKCSNPSNVETAMEWILEHGKDDSVPVSLADPSEPPSSSTGDVQPVSAVAAANDAEVNLMSTSQENSACAPPVALSIKCEECGKLFTSQQEVEFHAAKSNHSNFTESTEEKKPLTEEEKREQLSKIEAKLRQRRLEREEREKAEALEREKTRIRSGKEMLEAKQKHEELEVQRMVEQRKREKEDDRLAKQRVRDQIEQDKLARKARMGGGNVDSGSDARLETDVKDVIPSSVTTPLISIPQATLASQQTVAIHADVRLQIRLTNGSNLKQTFGAKEPLSAVRLYIEINRTDGSGPFTLMTAFPKRVFGPEDYDKPLDLLGLAPSSVLVVSKS